MKEHILISVRMTIVMVVLTCVIYPGVVFAIAQLVFPFQANGSLVADLPLIRPSGTFSPLRGAKGNLGGGYVRSPNYPLAPRSGERVAEGRVRGVVGSLLIGQPFTSERFFHSRPSASNYDGTNSGGTNLGPTSKKLRDAIAAATKAYDVQTNVPADAVTSSASGLDPHISPENAYAQAPRVARANRLGLDEVRQLIDRHAEHRFLGVYGEPRVNVLLINLEIAEHR